MLPKWSPDDKLMYIQDKTNWWNLYQLDGDKETNLCPIKKEIGGPAWVLERVRILAIQLVMVKYWSFVARYVLNN